MKPLFVVVLVVAVACARDPQKFLNTFDPCRPTRIDVPATITDSELASLNDAIGMWKAVAPIDVTLEDRPEQRVLPILFERAASAFYGLYEDQIPAISINDDITDEHTRAIVIAHELGHAMDLFHVSGRPSVMNTPNLKTAPNAADAETLLETWGACVSPAASR